MVDYFRHAADVLVGPWTRWVRAARPQRDRRPRAAIVTVGSELTDGLRVDTNTARSPLRSPSAAIDVAETASVGDDVDVLAETLERLSGRLALVVVTGGLGPTHDDITPRGGRTSASRPLHRDATIEAALEPSRRHRDAERTAQVLTQADVLEGAEVLPATTGTAPGQVVPTAGGLLVLLPGPPREMRPHARTRS